MSKDINIEFTEEEVRLMVGFFEDIKTHWRGQPNKALLVLEGLILKLKVPLLARDSRIKKMFGKK